MGAKKSARRDSRANGRYGAQQVEVLEGLEAVRRRPGMYVGGTDADALHHLAAELLDNALDEVHAGGGGRDPPLAGGPQPHRRARRRSRHPRGAPPQVPQALHARGDPHHPPRRGEVLQRGLQRGRRAPWRRPLGRERPRLGAGGRNCARGAASTASPARTASLGARSLPRASPSAASAAPASPSRQMRASSARAPSLTPCASSGCCAPRAFLFPGLKLRWQAASGVLTAAEARRIPQEAELRFEDGLNDLVGEVLEGARSLGGLPLQRCD